MEITPINQMRAELTETLQRFAAAGPLAEPVVFGRQRRPEAAIIPYALFEILADQINEDLRWQDTYDVANERILAGLRADAVLTSAEDVDELFDEVERREARASA